MKKIFMMGFNLLAFATNAISQECSTGPVQSPVVQKPMQVTASINCSSMLIQWQGNADKNYQLTIAVKDAATGKTIKAFSTSSYKHNGNSYAATISASPGTKVNWSVQAISILNNRTFISYPFRGREVTVPVCTALSSASANQNEFVTEANDKLKVTMFPNPVQSVLHLQLASSVAQKTVRVFDVYGRTLIMQHSSEQMIEVNTSALSKGFYLVQIAGENGKILFTAKFIKI